MTMKRDKSMTMMRKKRMSKKREVRMSSSRMKQGIKGMMRKMMKGSSMCNTVRVRRLMKMLNRGSQNMIHNSHIMIHNNYNVMNRSSLRVMKNNLLKRNNNLKKKRGNRINMCNTVRRTTLKRKCKRTDKASMKKSKTMEKMRSKVTRVKSLWSMC